MNRMIQSGRVSTGKLLREIKSLTNLKSNLKILSIFLACYTLLCSTRLDSTRLDSTLLHPTVLWFELNQWVRVTEIVDGTSRSLGLITGLTKAFNSAPERNHLMVMGLAVVIMRRGRGTHWRRISWLRYWCIALCMQECVYNSINLRLNHKSLIIGAANVQILLLELSLKEEKFLL